MGYETLHCHTTTSDGQLTYQQVLDLCAQKGVGVVAFTDHDSLPSKKNFAQLQKYTGPTQWVVGCELSSGWPKEIPGVSSDFHILGLFIDPFNPELVARNQKVQAARVGRMEQMVANLNQLGFTITTQDCLKASGGESVGRPHIVAALSKYPQNETLVERLRQQMAKAADQDPQVKEQYQAMVLRGPSQYPYALFLSKEAFIQGVYVKHGAELDHLDETVRLIHQAGGVALLAHWTFTKNQVGLAKIEELLQAGRLDGAEIIYGQGTVGREAEIAQDMADIRNLTSRLGALQSGGVDLHTAADLEAFVQNPIWARQTVGLTAKLLKDPRVHSQWSSLPTTT